MLLSVFRWARGALPWKVVKAQLAKKANIVQFLRLVANRYSPTKAGPYYPVTNGLVRSSGSRGSIYFPMVWTVYGEYSAAHIASVR
jgi:hypothetical protein